MEQKANGLKKPLDERDFKIYFEALSMVSILRNEGENKLRLSRITISKDGSMK